MTRKLSQFLCVGVIVLLSSNVAQASLIDFEDLNSSSGTFIPQGYNGFAWTGSSGTGSWVNNAAAPISGGFANSGVNFAWSNGGARLDLTGGIFSIKSLAVASLFGGSSTPIVTFEGKLNGSTVFTQSVQVNSTSYTMITLNFNGIDEFTFDGQPNTNLLVDDINYSNAAIPEPATFGMWAILGAAGIVLTRSRRLRKFGKSAKSEC